MAKPKLGSGERFRQLSNKIAQEYRSKGYSAAEARRIGDATAAKIGMEKYGKEKMMKMAKAGRKTR